MPPEISALEGCAAPVDTLEGCVP
eukprot:COSAG02_NODE_23978_length_702_cov_0.754561_2_plen_23_part_01